MIFELQMLVIVGQDMQEFFAELEILDDLEQEENEEILDNVQQEILEDLVKERIQEYKQEEMLMNDLQEEKLEEQDCRQFFQHSHNVDRYNVQLKDVGGPRNHLHQISL